MTAGRFREDLFYRLNVVEVELPPLRERREDIPYLTAAFLGECAQRMQKPLTGLTAAAERMLLSAPWDGNVRELKNAVERACMLAEGNLLTEREVSGGLGPTLGGQAGQSRTAGAGVGLPAGRPSAPSRGRARAYRRRAAPGERQPDGRCESTGHQPPRVVPSSGPPPHRGCDLTSAMIKEKYASADARHEGTLLPPEASVLGSIKTLASKLMKGAAPQGTPVLVVDDEEAVLRFVDRVLRDAGYKTAIANSGPEAIEVAKKIGPLGALVTDVMMPGMTGDELARVLRQTEPALKVLYLTGYSDRLFKEKAMLWADEAFLDKPCTVKGLREAVSLLLFGKFDASEEPPVKT